MSAPRFSVIIPTRGDRPSLDATLAALRVQTIAPESFEVHVAVDGDAQSAPRGPGAARNEGAQRARGEWLAFTDDDCEPAPDWLERAAARVGSGEVDVLQGANYESGGRPLLQYDDPTAPGALTTNLFVRAALFQKVGGFDPAFADPARDLYFREDSDLVMRLAAAGARVRFADDIHVSHAPLFTSAGAVLRHARRFELDALLYARHPRAFRASIEAKQMGPFRIRRPFHIATLIAMVEWLGAVFQLATGHPNHAAAFAVAALVSHAVAAVRYARGGFAPYWAGWLAPFLYVAALGRGCFRYGGWGVWR